jgi:tetratricopeptide (TPR) repeat protein
MRSRTTLTVLAFALALAAAPAGARADQAPAPSPSPAPAEAPAASATAPAAPAVAPEDDARRRTVAERDASYLAFRQEFDAGRYTEALPHAERVAELTELLGAQHPDLARSLNNLGATQYRLGDFGAAEKSYVRAIRIIEETQGSLSPRLLAPLRGLGLTFEGSGRHELAVPLLERALAISRRNRGLFNPEQKDLLEPLAEGYVALGRYRDADRTQRYTLAISEHAYGENDPRLIPALRELGQWLERSGQRNASREVWERLKALASDRAHPDPIAQIVALRGIAMSYRYDYQFGSEPIERRPGELLMPDPFETDPSRNPALLGPHYLLSSAGEDALKEALAIAEKLPARTALGVVLVDLGDWQYLSNRPDKALAYLHRALPLLAGSADSAESDSGPLSRPVQLLYRQPELAERYRDQPPSAVTEKYAIAEFTVTAEGRVRDVQIVEGDASDGARGALSNAIAHAIYRPRFVDGQPVATSKVRFRESFRQLKS